VGSGTMHTMENNRKEEKATQDLLDQDPYTHPPVQLIQGGGEPMVPFDEAVLPLHPNHTPAAQDVFEQRTATISDALDKAMLETSQYYDLELSVPAASLSIPFTLSFRNLSARNNTGAVTIYSSPQESEDNSLRVPIPGGIVVKQ
jgi:hypothetical protein